MILINLLPHREAARKRRREAFYGTLVGAAILGVLIAGLGYLWFEAQISAQQDRNSFLKAEITKLEVEIKEISTLQEEIAALRARQQAVEDLGNNSPWLVKPELVEITSATVSLSQRDQRRVANFTMRIGLKRPTDAQKAEAEKALAAKAPSKG